MPSTTALMFHRILLILKNNRSFLYSYKPLRFHEDTIPAHGSFLILQIGIKHKMGQNELPQNIIIISDMEFDSCAEGANETAFEKIEKE